ncbi:SDR family oxidoreductase [Spirillospora sp. CA-253888]
MPDFQGKRVLVSGGGRGVGKVISRRFALAGAQVFVNWFHSGDEAHRTVRELRALGAQVDELRGSVAKPEQVRQMLDRVRRQAGGLDVLVNNAAAGRLRPMTELTERDWRRTWQTCLQGTVDFSLQAAGIMSGGAIVNLSSIGAGMVMGNYATVGVTKAAVEAATRYLAVELAPSGIRVNCASSIPIDSEVLGLFPDHDRFRAVVEEAAPLGRLVTAEEYADLVLFLASPAAGMITGQTVLVDGGLSLGASMLTPPAHRRVASPTAPRRPSPQDGATAPEPGHDAEFDAGEAIAVVGIGAIVPGAAEVRSLWRLLLEGEPVFGEPGGRWPRDAHHSPDPASPDRNYASCFGFITTEVNEGSRNEDYTTTWLRTAIGQAWQEQAPRPDDKVALLVGATPDGSQHLEESVILAMISDLTAEHPGGAELADIAKAHLKHARSRPERSLPHVSVWDAARSLLPSDTDVLTVDTACSSSLYAVDVGMRRLRAGACDIAVCGGTFAVTPRAMTLFSKLKGLSTSGGLHALSEEADGTLFSDGAAVVVLKTLERARADGDRIYGVITGVGVSCDGKGKAIYAPNGDGQVRALRRAYRGGPAPATTGWIVAHGTGTPAGDLVEIGSLKNVFTGPGPVAVTSNKSLIGHTGWTAGVVSLIHLLLGFEHDRIPAQRPAARPPRSWELPSHLFIPSEPVPWHAPGQDRPRQAAVNSFGFGGTNAHASVLEPHPGLLPAPSPAKDDDQIVVVGWNAVLPDAPDRERITAWLNGELPDWPARFRSPPEVPFRMLPMPPGGQDRIDAVQRLALLAADGLREQLGSVWTTLSDTTGVIGAHCGLTLNASRYALRCALAGLDGALDAHPDASRQARAAFADLIAHSTTGIDAPTEDSYPGAAPGLAPARVAMALDVHGLTMGVDTGTASGMDSLAVAGDYLRSGDLDLALVVAVNGNALGAWEGLLRPALGPGTGRLAEGALCLALTRRSIAERFSLVSLGQIAPGVAGQAVPAAPPPGPSHLAADSAFAVLGHLLRRQSTMLAWTDPLTERTKQLAITIPEQPSKPAAKTGAKTGPRESSSAATKSAPKTAVDRFAVEFRPVPAEPLDQITDLFPDHCVIVTNAPDALAGHALPEHCLTLSAASEVGLTLAPLCWRPRHLRILAAPGTDEQLTDLHDLAFLVVKELFDDLAQGTTAVVLCDAVEHGLPTAAAGLFTGFVKTLACDWPEAELLCLITGTPRFADALRELKEELGVQRATPVVVHPAPRQRREPQLVPLAAPDPTAPLALGPSSVVVAIGGSRGITAELLMDLAKAARPRMWILGSSPIGGEPEPPETTGRANYIKQARARDPRLSLPDAAREYDRLSALRSSRRHLRALADVVGTDKVTYLTCDVRDPEAVERAIARIHARTPRIDLLLFAAGANRPAGTPRKPFEHFRLVRDIKVCGHRNLTRALADRPPARWINFGSIAALAGQPGELDYAAANDYLAMAAGQADARGQDHFTVGWPVWRDTGLASDPMLQRRLARTGLTRLPTEQGVRLFRAELADASHPPYRVLLGAGDMAVLEQRFPDLVTDTAPSRVYPLLGPGPFSPTDSAVLDCSIDTERHPYLMDHLVDGRPTVPGTFLVEMAVEAATTLRPSLLPVAVLDGEFTHFVRTHPRQGRATFQIKLETVTDDPAGTRIAVTFSSDVRSPTGKLLEADRFHATCTVVLAESTTPATAPVPTPPLSAVPLPDPYYLPNESITLSGPFVTTAATTADDGHAYGRFCPPPQLTEPPFRDFHIPALLLDGLARISVLNARTSQAIPVFALKSFRRVVFHRPGPDAEAAAAMPVHLLSAPETAPSGANPPEDVSYRCSAVSHTGAALITIEGLRGHPKGRAATPPSRRPGRG